jgi:hypothetical protein
MQYDFDEQDDFRPGCGFVALAAAVIRGGVVCNAGDRRRA